MKIKELFKTWWPKRKQEASHLSLPKEKPLREFIYLDEVSLRSLLASQTGAVEDIISEAISKAENAEIAAELSADAIIGKGQFNSRYQTTNSRSIQTSRKAVIQSLFKDFVDLEGVNIYFSAPIDHLEQSSLPDDLFSIADPNLVLPSTRIRRGDLIEIEVELAVDPIFTMSTIVSEFLDMAQSTPEIIAMTNLTQQLREAGPMNSLLQHLLAGLIPIRARAINYCVACGPTEEYVVHKKATCNVGFEIHPLQVVGVTEHLGYWKDIRRVLFSSAKFTMLCRVSRDGIQRSWTPVKLVDLLDAVAPEFRRQIESIGKANLDPSTQNQPATDKNLVFEKSLYLFSDKYLSQIGHTMGEDERHNLYEFTKELVHNMDVNSATAQNQAFKEVAKYISLSTDGALQPEKLLEIRKEARSDLGIDCFGNLPSSVNTATAIGDAPQDRMIDTEIIAIYW